MDSVDWVPSCASNLRIDTEWGTVEYRTWKISVTLKADIMLPKLIRLTPNDVTTKSRGPFFDKCFKIGRLQDSAGNVADEKRYHRTYSVQSASVIVYSNS